MACEVMSPAQSCSALSGQHGFLHGCCLWSGRHCSRLAAVTHGVFERQQEEDLCKRYHWWYSTVVGNADLERKRSVVLM